MRRTDIPLADLTDAPQPSGPRKIGHPATGLLLDWENSGWRLVDGTHPSGGGARARRGDDPSDNPVRREHLG